MVLPKHNALDCGCAVPLKLTSVENVVGRGVFKLKWQKEELLLYSKEGACVSQEWVTAIQEATNKHKTAAATLRKESSRRTPLKRPDMLKLRRETLSQIMMLRLTKEKAKKLLLTPKSGNKAGNSKEVKNVGASPVLKKRRSVTAPESGGPDTPKSAKRQKTTAAGVASTPPQSKEAPAKTPQIRAQLRAKNNEPTLRWRSLMRKKVETQQHAKVSLFRSPSIFDKEDGSGDDDVMAKYLAGQMVPLTPSQAPTNVSHLVRYKPPPISAPVAKEKQVSSDGSTLSESFSLKTPRKPRMVNNDENCDSAKQCDDVTMSPSAPSSPAMSYCSVM